MIDLYTWGTPNGRKISIMLEEVGLEYKVHPVDITKGDQHQPTFLSISPNNKIPAIFDYDQDQSLFESGAILIYLAEKTGKFLPSDPKSRMDTLQWLMFQMGGVGPMFGQTHHFNRFAKEKIAYAIDRYVGETKRLYGVMNAKLEKSAYLAGDAYTIADIATWPWVSRFEWHGLDDGLNGFQAVRRWYSEIAERPAVLRGYDVPANGHVIPKA